MQDLPSLLIVGLKTKFVGKNVLYYPTLPSTMDTARQAARAGAPAGAVIIAGEQTAARGRLNRPWISPPGNIAMSIILYPDISGLPYLMMIASLSVINAIETVAGVKARIKWPNDILIGGKKVGGILIENEVRGDKVVFSLIGIGINVDLKVDSYVEIAGVATSLSGQADSRLRIVRSLLTDFERLYLKLPDGRAIYKAWRSLLVTLGKKVRATSGPQIIEGIAEFVDETGALVIRRPDGSLTRVVAGDVTLRER